MTIAFRNKTAGLVLVAYHVFGNSDAFSLRSGAQSTDAKPAAVAYQNSPDPDFPWRFEGRAMLRPALVRVEDDASTTCYTTLSFFGWTIGGCVALEYDTSPAGIPYREFVVLRSLGWLGGLAVGQVGKALYVNETEAVAMCEDIWDLPANRASRLDFVSDPEGQMSISMEEESKFEVKGWSTLHSSRDGPNVQLPLLWTPTITGIWTDAILDWLRATTHTELDLRKLRVSGGARLQLSGETETPSSMSMIPLGVDIVLCNAVIEISPSLPR